MACIDCFLVPVPLADRRAREAQARVSADDTVVVSWVEWPDEASCDSGMARLTSDPCPPGRPIRLQASPVRVGRLAAAMGCVAFALAAGGLCSGASAQAVRGNRVVCAIDAPVCARANAERDETLVERSDARTRTSERLWSVPRWLNLVRIDEAGEALLVEVQSTLEMGAVLDATAPLLALYRRDATVREFTVAELFGSPRERDELRRAPAWGRRLPSPDADVVRYLLASGRTVRVALASGQLSFE